jgi:hypothetical protein
MAGATTIFLVCSGFAFLATDPDRRRSSKIRLEAEDAIIRHQLIVLQRKIRELVEQRLGVLADYLRTR